MPRLFAALLLALTPMLASAEEVIRVYNWNDYIAPQVLKDFEAETGIRVDYHTYSTAEELAAVLATGEAIDKCSLFFGYFDGLQILSKTFPLHLFFSILHCISGLIELIPFQSFYYNNFEF